MDPFEARDKWGVSVQAQKELERRAGGLYRMCRALRPVQWACLPGSQSFVNSHCNSWGALMLVAAGAH